MLPESRHEKPEARIAGLGASEDQAVISWPGDVVRRGGLTRCLPSLSDPLIIGTTRMKLDPMTGTADGIDSCRIHCDAAARGSHEVGCVQVGEVPGRRGVEAARL